MASGPPVTGLGDTEEEFAVINGNQRGSFSLSFDSEASLHGSSATATSLAATESQLLKNAASIWVFPGSNSRTRKC